MLVPQVDLGQVGEATLGEGPEEVERGGGLLVGRHETRRIGTPRLFVERLVVHHVPTERVELGVADALGGRRTRLGELARDASDLDHRHAGGVGECHRHLQDDLQLVADRIGREVGERLRAVTGLEEERPAVRNVGQLSRQAPGLTGENEWRKCGELCFGLLERVGVRPLRLLCGREPTP